MLMHTGTEAVPSENNLLTTIAWQIGDAPVEYALEGSVFIAGAVVQWLRDGLGIIQRSEDVERLAQSVEDNGGVYLVPAFAGLGAPHWDPYARGTITGLTRGTTAGHIARAALEGIAYQITDVLGAMEADSGIDVKELRVDGGAAVNDLLMQFQADVLGVPVVRPEVTETTALGAAYLAGLAVGFWESQEEITRQWAMEQTFTPALPDAERDALLEGWKPRAGSCAGVGGAFGGEREEWVEWVEWEERGIWEERRLEERRNLKRQTQDPYELSTSSSPFWLAHSFGCGWNSKPGTGARSELSSRTVRCCLGRGA